MHRDDGSSDAPTFEELRRRLRTRQEDFRIAEVAEGRRRPGEKTLGADGEFVLLPYSAARREAKRRPDRLTAGIALSTVLALGVAGWLFMAPGGSEEPVATADGAAATRVAASAPDSAAPAPLAGGTTVGAAPELHTVDPAARAAAPSDPTRDLFARSGETPIRDGRLAAPADVPAQAPGAIAGNAPSQPAPGADAPATALPAEDAEAAIALRFPDLDTAPETPPVDQRLTTGTVRPEAQAPVQPRGGDPQVAAAPQAGPAATPPAELRPTEPDPGPPADMDDMAALGAPDAPVPPEPAPALAPPEDLAGEPGQPETGEPETAPQRTSSIRSAVNMRAGPSNDAPVVGVVADGASIEVVSCTIWCEIIYDGKRGYVFRSFVSDGG